MAAATIFTGVYYSKESVSASYKDPEQGTSVSEDIITKNANQKREKVMKVMNGMQSKKINDNAYQYVINEGSTNVIMDVEKIDNGINVMVTNNKNNGYIQLVRNGQNCSIITGEKVNNEYVEDTKYAYVLNTDTVVMTCGKTVKTSKFKVPDVLDDLIGMENVYWYKEEASKKTDYVKIGCKAKYKINYTKLAKSNPSRAKKVDKYMSCIDKQISKLNACCKNLGYSSVSALAGAIGSIGTAGAIAAVVSAEALAGIIAAIAIAGASGFGINVSAAVDNLLASKENYDKAANLYLDIRKYGSKY